MGEAKRRRRRQEQAAWPSSGSFRGVIDLHLLPPASEINGARLRELTGDDRIPDHAAIVLRAFRAVVGKRSFHVGFCLGDGAGFSAVGHAVIVRLGMEVADAPLHVVPVAHRDIAWDIVLRHLRSFTGKALLFAFPDSDTYDAGTAEVAYSQAVRQFDPEGDEVRRLSPAERRRVRERVAAIRRQPPPEFYPAPGVEREEAPWIFSLVTPAGKALRTAVWNGRRDYAHELPEDMLHWVGGDRIALVQVDRPVGVEGRSSLALTHHFAKDFDGVIHWARDTATFQSIVRSFVRLDLESVGPTNPLEGWNPELVIFAARSDPDDPEARGPDEAPE